MEGPSRDISSCVALEPPWRQLSMLQNVLRGARRVGLLSPLRAPPGGTFVRCAYPKSSAQLKEAVIDASPIAAAILSSGVRSPTDVARIVDAASKLPLPSASDDLPVGGVFESVAQHQLYEILFGTGTTLSLDGFRGFGDAASMTLLAPRGVGKTTALKAFAVIAPLFDTKLIPIYISYLPVGRDADTAAIKEDATYVARNTILDMVADALEVHGIYVKPTLDSIVEGLRKADKYALLLIDEVDKFYESRGNQAQPLGDPARRWSTEHQTLSELAQVGNDSRGRIAAILCGSSSLLGDLVTTNLRHTPGAMADFPVLNVALNINGQKFRTTRLTYSPPNDFDAGRTCRQPLVTAATGAAMRARVAYSSLTQSSTPSSSAPARPLGTSAASPRAK